MELWVNASDAYDCLFFFLPKTLSSPLGIDLWEGSGLDGQLFENVHPEV